MKDMMFLKSYKECIDDIETLMGREMAEKFALEIVHYGVTGERLNKLVRGCEFVLAGIIPFIDNSAKKNAAAIKRSEEYKKGKSSKSKPTKDKNGKSKNLN